MLRVLRDGALNITENTVGSLDSLANLSQHEPAVFAPYSKIRDILPSREVYTAVSNSSVLKKLQPRVTPLGQASASCHITGQDRGIPQSPQNRVWICRGAAPPTAASVWKP